MKYEFYVSEAGQVRLTDEQGNDFALVGKPELVKELADEFKDKFRKAWDACLKVSRDAHKDATADENKCYAVSRFLRCNFGNRDLYPDWKDGTWEFEEVKCHLRGCCQWENIICRPACTHLKTETEKHVAMLCMGNDSYDISKKLDKAISTVDESLSKVRNMIGAKRNSEIVRKFRGLHLERRVGLI